MTNNIMAFSVAARLDAAGADLTAMAGEIGAISSRVDALNVKVGAAADGGRNVASSASGGGGRGRKKEKGNKKANTERGDRSGAGITAGALETLKPADPILMHVVVRADLVSGLGWPVGSVITQACHASVAAIARFRDSSLTEQYLADLEGMRKVSVEVKNEAALLKLAASLDTAGVDHHLWIEQPEGIPTALATAPRFKSTVPKALKKCKLFKNPVYPPPPAAV